MWDTHSKLEGIIDVAWKSNGSTSMVEEVQEKLASLLPPTLDAGVTPHSDKVRREIKKLENDLEEM